MINLLNLLKKKPEIEITPKTVESYYDIDGKRFAISESMDIKVQSSANDVQVYGWTLENTWKSNDGEYYQWMTHWNNRIYNSRSSALDAAIKISKQFGKSYKWRITPIYKMTQPQYRDYQIDQILEFRPTPKKEIKAWKTIRDHEEIIGHKPFKIKKGTIFLQMENGEIIRVATTSDPTCHGLGYILRNYLLPKGIVQEIDITDEKWAHPHLLKELKIKLKLK